MGSCVVVDYSESGESFEPCRTACKQELPSLDVSAICLTVNRNARKQYDFAIHRTEPIGYAIEVTHGGCGCLTAEISADGRLANLEVVYSNLGSALDLFAKEIDYIQIDSPVESCLIDAVVPIVFGIDAESATETNGRRHTIHPVYKFISENRLLSA